MKNKILTRLRRAKRTRAKIQRAGEVRLSVHRSNENIYAQIIAPDARVLASAATVEKTLKDDFSYGGNCKAAAAVGKLIAERALAAGVSAVAFDRSGFKYHGRVKALAEAAREAGLKF